MCVYNERLCRRLLTSRTTRPRRGIIYQRGYNILWTYIIIYIYIYAHIVVSGQQYIMRETYCIYIYIYRYTLAYYYNCY